MRLLNVVLILVLALMFAAGCSDSQKDAAKLEQEVMDMEGGTDTISTETSAAVESVAAETPVADAADAVPTEEQRTPTFANEAPTGDGWTVQVASCESGDYAEHLTDVYSARGYEPYVTTFSHAGQQYYRVRIGAFESEAEARELKLELTDRYSINPWIARIGQ
ncbi:MAG: SPOR domain-containing protein [candidate division Zixibacteria bacterium]|nr:SPOR domain-containing protein [candidate division Zixibacteria bacterium]